MLLLLCFLAINQPEEVIAANIPALDPVRKITIRINMAKAVNSVLLLCFECISPPEASGRLNANRVASPAGLSKLPVALKKIEFEGSRPASWQQA